MDERSRAAVTIVTYNSARYIRQCLECVLAQEPSPAEVVVVDNASTDETRAILREFRERVRVVYNTDNRGFAGSHNQAIALTSAPWVLVLNPDVRLPSNFLAEMIAAGEREARIGTVSGKLR